MMLSAIAGGVSPAIRVGGISRSGTSLRNLSHAVVVANEPMPSVSKKSDDRAEHHRLDVWPARFADRGAGEHEREQEDREDERYQKRNQHWPLSMGDRLAPL